jgi:hypothetical protein
MRETGSHGRLLHHGLRRNQFLLTHPSRLHIIVASMVTDAHREHVNKLDLLTTKSFRRLVCDDRVATLSARQSLS